MPEHPRMLPGFTFREPDETADEKLLRDVREHGWHVVGIPDDEEGPDFSFTIKGDRASIFSESNGLYFRLREAFEAGREVTCFVDPHDPRFCALEKDVRVTDLIGCFGLGVPFAIIGSLYLVRFIGISRKKRP